MRASSEISDDEQQRSLARDFRWEFSGPFYTDAALPHPQYVNGFGWEKYYLCRHLLDTMVIRDQFDKDHEARREFIVAHKLNGFLQRRSKLRLNNLAVALTIMRQMREHIQNTFPGVGKKLVAIWPTEAQNAIDSRPYKDMTFDQKVATARKVDEAVYQFLEVLAK